MVFSASEKDKEVWLYKTVQLRPLYYKSNPLRLIHSETASTFLSTVDLLAVIVEISPFMYRACMYEVEVNNPAYNYTC
ncbi:hypothetical protein SAMN05444008_105120 [Cnuella takakiae]|uniref:Uncharacterized protein n=1 Tax=Cnuella takakiae TaxID=1302690 RepID=A0A1M4Z7U3_9BACT|nr:hypothetical protein SAMN05444008_105120 [Cnuella takakiae]